MSGISYRNRNEGKVDRYGKKKKPNWEYRISLLPEGGKEKRLERCGFARKQDAIDAATAVYAEYMNDGSIFKPCNLSYSDCLDKWMQDYCELSCNDTTRSNYEKKIRLHIKPRIGMYRVTAVTTEVIQNLINELVKEKYSRNTLSVIKGIISKSLKYAKRMKWVRFNEAADVELPPTRISSKLRSKQRVALSKEKIMEIMERFPEGHSCHIPLLLGYRCGVRIGEAFAFEWKDIDFTRGILYVRKQVQWYPEKKQWRILPPKYNSCRVVDVDQMTLAVLKRAKVKQAKTRLGYGELYTRIYKDSEGFLNTEGNGEEVSMVTVRDNGTYIQSRVMQHCSKVVHQELDCPEFDFHTLRHTHATELAEAGVNIKEIQRRLGHKSVQITEQRYIHATDKMREDSIEILNGMYQNSSR